MAPTLPSAPLPQCSHRFLICIYTIQLGIPEYRPRQHKVIEHKILKTRRWLLQGGQYYDIWVSNKSSKDLIIENSSLLKKQNEFPIKSKWLVDNKR